MQNLRKITKWNCFGQIFLLQENVIVVMKKSYQIYDLCRSISQLHLFKLKEKQSKQGVFWLVKKLHIHVHVAISSFDIFKLQKQT